MQVYEAVRTILAVRSYQDKPIPEETLHRIVEAGRLTGSSMNRQPWHFIVVRNRETLRQIGEQVTYASYTAEADAAIIVAVERTEYAVSDGSRAIQSMLLTAWDAGVGSNWAGWLGMDQLKPLLGVPDHLDLLAILPLGYPAQPTGKGKKMRKSLNEVAHSERFGTPLTFQD
mgnify:CR=1 FL=1